MAISHYDDLLHEIAPHESIPASDFNGMIFCENDEEARETQGDASAGKYELFIKSRVGELSFGFEDDWAFSLSRLQIA